MHHAGEIRAVLQPEHVTKLMHGFFDRPLQQSIASGRKPCLFLAQSRQGNHTDHTCQFRLAEHEVQVGGEKVNLRYPKYPVIQ